MPIAGKKWQLDLIAATRGNQTRLGSIFLAALGKRPPSNRRMFSRHAVITKSGKVVADFIDSRGDVHAAQIVCTVQELRDNFRGLADHCKLSDKDREELFNTIRSWISRDYSGLGVDFKKLTDEEKGGPLQ